MINNKRKDRLESEIIGYIKGMWDAGDDRDSEDILMSGLINGQINVTNSEIQKNWIDIVNFMENNLNDCSLSISDVRFLCRLMKKGYFTFYQQEKISYMYELTAHGLREYTTLPETKMIQIRKNINENRIKKNNKG